MLVGIAYGGIVVALIRVNQQEKERMMSDFKKGLLAGVALMATIRVAKLLLEEFLDSVDGGYR